MIDVRIQIGDGATEDVFAAHKLIYMDADHRTEAPIKKRDVSSYLGEPGEHVDPRTVQDAFDYKVRFIIDGQNTDLKNVNAIVAAFNRKLYTQTAGSGIRIYKEIAFYNDFKRVKIVGLPEPIAEPKEMKRSRNGYDFAEVELTIHVSDPTKCDFNLKDTPMMPISLSTDGPNLYLNLPRPLKSNEFIALLTRGSNTNSNHLNRLLSNYWKSRYRWHVYMPNEYSVSMAADGKLTLPSSYGKWDSKQMINSKRIAVTIPKSRHSTFTIPAIAGRSGKVCYGIAICESRRNRLGYKRVSDVCYFWSNVRVDSVDKNGPELSQWFTV